MIRPVYAHCIANDPLHLSWLQTQSAQPAIVEVRGSNAGVSLVDGILASFLFYCVVLLGTLAAGQQLK